MNFSRKHLCLVLWTVEPTKMNRNKFYISITSLWTDRTILSMPIKFNGKWIIDVTTTAESIHSCKEWKKKNINSLRASMIFISSDVIAVWIFFINVISKKSHNLTRGRFQLINYYRMFWEYTFSPGHIVI